MIYIGIDLGYRNETSIVIVRPDNPALTRFQFRSVRENTEFHDVIDKIANIMRELQVPLKNVSAPASPAVMHALSRIFDKDAK